MSDCVPVPARVHQVDVALAHLEAVLKEQDCQLVIDREDGVFRLIPNNFYLDPMEEHDESDQPVPKGEFREIDVPIQVFDDYYHGIYRK